MQLKQLFGPTPSQLAQLISQGVQIEQGDVVQGFDKTGINPTGQMHLLAVKTALGPQVRQLFTNRPEQVKQLS